MPRDVHRVAPWVKRITVPTPTPSSRAIRRSPVPSARAARFAATFLASVTSIRRRPRVTPSSRARARPARTRSRMIARSNSANSHAGLSERRAGPLTSDQAYLAPVGVRHFELALGAKRLVALAFDADNRCRSFDDDVKPRMTTTGPWEPILDFQPYRKRRPTKIDGKGQWRQSLRLVEKITEGVGG
jgi:hypothetical protein